MNVKKYVLGMVLIFITSSAMFASYDLMKDGIEGK